MDNSLMGQNSNARFNQPSHPHIRDGFRGQRMLVLPQPVVRQALAHGDAADLLTTDIGYFPSAAWHDVDRPQGSNQMIVIYCVHGIGWACLVENEFVVRAGDVLVIPPNTSHAYGSAGRRPWTIYWAHLAGNKVKTILQLLTENGADLLFKLGREPEIVALFTETFDHLEHGYGPHNLLMASLTAGRLCSRLISQRQIIARSDSPRERIQRTVEFMKRRLDKHVNVTELAQLADYSSSHFSARFHEQIGYAPLDYFMRLKMRRAGELLDATDNSIKDIASRIGFTDALYFSRKFSQFYELSPSDYRRLRKG
jgi:AraC-like DNA-binding protein